MHMLLGRRIWSSDSTRSVWGGGVAVLLLSLMFVGCGEVEQQTDAQLKQKLMGRWRFETETALGDLEFNSHNRMLMRAKGKAVLQRFRGEIKHKWKIENGCLDVYVHDAGNDLSRLLFWPGSAQQAPIKIEQLDDQQLVLKDVGTLERIQTQ